MKIIAKQVPPEYQDPCFEPANWPGIIFHGNRWFKSHTTPEFDAIYDRFDGEKRILRALHLVTGERYEKRTIRGTCQSDWQEIYYPVADYSKSDICFLEIEYFNLGSEWTVTWHDEEFGMYCYGDTPEDVRLEIASIIGVNADDIVLYEFSGWSRTPEYKEVTA